MVVEQQKTQFAQENAGLLCKRAKVVAAILLSLVLVTTVLDQMHLNMPFWESFSSKTPMVALSLAILAFGNLSLVRQYMTLILCLLMLSLQLSVYIKSVQYGDYAPLASVVVFSCLFSAYFIPWCFKCHLAVTIGALLLVSHWTIGFASADDWVVAARGTFSVSMVVIGTAVLAYFNEGERLEDWNEKQILRRNDQMFRQLGDYTSDIVFIWNPDLSIDYVSPSFERYTGRTVKDLLTTSLKVSDLISPGGQDRYRRFTENVLKGEEQRDEITLVHADGTEFQVEIVSSPILNQDGKVEKAIAVWRDNTVRSAKEKSLKKLAGQDLLTRTYNQDYFQKLATAELEQAVKTDRSVTFLHLDIDGFRHLTEQYGLAAGDQVIIEVTERIREVLKEDSAICRSGGDNFLIMLSGVTLERAELVASELITEVGARPVLYEDHLLPVSLCVGIASSESGNQIAYEDLLDLSAKALYQSKRDGRGSYTVSSLAI